MNPSTFNDRLRLWQDMASGNAVDWDIIVVGGGITGAGILREAVRRGYKTLLLEQRDFAWGTSSRSSKLVHGGIRYLAAGKLSLTRHALHERERLIKEAPHLVERLGFYFPIYKNHFPPRFAAGILFWLYDRIAGIRDHRRLDNEQLAKVFKGIDTTRLDGAYYYTDAVTDDSRLTLRVLHESVSAGASLRNYSKAVGLLEDKDGVHGLTVEDVETKEQLQLRSRVVVNATGAWAERLGDEPAPGMKIRPQRGSHLVLSAEKFPISNAIFLLHPADGRRLFVYPWEGRTIVGTTDIHHPEELDIAASISREELRYLLDAAVQIFPQQPPQETDVISTWSGVRPIITSGRSSDPSKASREHRVWTERGLVSCSGGKLTTFHHMAKDVLSMAEQYLPPGTQASSQRIFRHSSLRGMDVLPDEPERGELLLGRYGEDAAALLNTAPIEEHKVIPGTRACLAQVRWALRHESVVHLDDLMLRRTRLGLLLENGGEAVWEDVRQIFSEVLGWTDEKWQSELLRYRDLIRQYYGVPPSA